MITINLLKLIQTVLLAVINYMNGGCPELIKKGTKLL